MARGIYLVGFSGSGKSTIARVLARQLQWPACDLDEWIVEQTGMTVPAIFEQEGESGFRAREAEALRTVSAGERFIVATGGGTIVRPENRSFMASKGWVICLEARPETILTRIQNHLKESGIHAVRPMLESPDPLEAIRALKQTRQAVYKLADWTVHTDDLTQEQVAAAVMRAAESLEQSAVRTIPG